MKKLLIIIVGCFILMATSPLMASMTISVSGKACPSFAGQTFPVPTATTGDSSDYHLDQTDPGTMPPWISAVRMVTSASTQLIKSMSI
jgi:hypothetical protein